MVVRCVDNRPFLQEAGNRLVVGSGSGEMISLTRGKTYAVLSVEQGWYRLVDDTGDDYLYPPSLFEIVQETPEGGVT